MGKPILVLDFDGVLHAYTSKWTTADEVLDGPVPGAMEALMAYLPRFEVCIISSRSKDPGGIEAMKEWLRDSLASIGVRAFGDEPDWLVVGDGGHLLRFPTEKPPAFLTIDDRAFTFEGRFPTVDEILAFKPWNKRPAGHLPATEALHQMASAKHHVASIYGCTDPAKAKEHARWAIEALQAIIDTNPED